MSDTGLAFRKIPTLFVRDFDGNPSLVLEDINPVAQWVANGEGVATLKLDGTCCYVDMDGKFFRRLDVKTSYKKGKLVTRKTPDDFILVEEDKNTGHCWVRLIH